MEKKCLFRGSIENDKYTYNTSILLHEAPARTTTSAFVFRRFSCTIYSAVVNIFWSFEINELIQQSSGEASERGLEQCCKQKQAQQK